MIVPSSVHQESPTDQVELEPGKKLGDQWLVSRMVMIPIQSALQLETHVLVERSSEKVSALRRWCEAPERAVKDGGLPEI